MNRFKRAETASICLFLAFALLFPVSASGNCFGWYCPHRTDGIPPELPPEYAFIEAHSGYYLDRNAREDDKVIYLTFDAGYENGNVGKIVDILNAHNAEGAFFILSNLARSNPELLQKMSEGGHLICNHTSSHKNMTKMQSEEAFSAELREMEEVYREATGEELAPFYRPPEGAFNEENLIWAENCGYSTVFWSFAYADWDNDRQPSPEKAFNKVYDCTHNGMVLLLHPTSATNAAILDRLLTEWEKDGYRFGSLYELCGK